jgi:hypothetical protein
MKKGPHDTREWTEIVNGLITQRTSKGDSIKMVIRYKTQGRPQVFLEFSTLDPAKRKYEGSEEITDWLPTSPLNQRKDVGGKPMAGFINNSSPDWRTFIDTIFGPSVQMAVKAGGRSFSYKEEMG